MSKGCRDDGCDLRHCVVCGRHPTKTDPQACPRCVGRVGGALSAIEATFAALADELIATGSVGFDPLGRSGAGSKILGGNVLVLLGPGNADGRPDAGVELASDPHPPLAILASWVDDWREIRDPNYDHEETPTPATVAAAVRYLRGNLAWAAEHHPAFADFAGEIFAIRSHLDAATQTHTGPDRGVGCPYCGERLVRRYAKPDPCPDQWVPPLDTLGYGLDLEYGIIPGYWRPCRHDGPGHDQGGQRDGWECPNRDCGRAYTGDEYRFAVWQAWAETRQNTAV